MSRGKKLLRNLMVCVFCLLGVWFLAGRPLFSLEREYSRAEKSYFMEEKEILAVWEPDGRILSCDAENLYLYQQEGFFVPDRSIQSFPLEEGFGFAMAVNRGVGQVMEFFAYDASGKADTATLKYTISQDGKEACAYNLGVLGENGVFRFCLTQTPLGYTDDGWPLYDGGEPELMTDIYEVWQGYSICTNYDFSITFYQGDREVGSLQERR